MHEFLPHSEAKVHYLAEKMGVSPKRVRAKIESLQEANPMLGHRGCRLGIMYPEITAMQAKAIIEAACKVAKEGKKVFPEIMIPLVADVNELIRQKAVVDQVAQEVMAKAKNENQLPGGDHDRTPQSCHNCGQDC